MAKENYFSPEIETLMSSLADVCKWKSISQPEKFEEDCNRLFGYAVAEQSDELFAVYFGARLEKARINGDYSNIESDATNAVSHQIKAGYFKEAVRTYKYLSIRAAHQGDIIREAQCYYHGLDIAQYHALYDDAAIMATNLANLYYRAGDFTTAIDLYQLAEENNELAHYRDEASGDYCTFMLNTANAMLADHRYYEVKRYKQNIDEFVTEMERRRKRYQRFPVKVFYAWYYFCQEQPEEMAENLSQARKCLGGLDSIVQNHDAIEKYINVLYEAGHFEELAEMLDYFIECCHKENADFQTARVFYQRRIELALMKQDTNTALEGYIEMMSLFDKSEQGATIHLREAKERFIAQGESEKFREEITERNEKLREGIEKAKSENAAKSVFISSMSHEIRTPINAVLGMDEMIIRETSEDNIKNYAYDIRNAGKNLLSIVNNILDFSKIEAGKMEIVPQEYKTADMLHELYTMNALRATKKGLALDFRVSSKLPSCMYGDDVRIKQIITNLMTNAIKYTETGSVTVDVGGEQKEEVFILKVRVQDTGIGMKQEEMDKLFNPFERMDLKKTRTIEGTGLGMNIVTNLLKQMGSEIHVESEYGHGSTFSFEIDQKVVDSTPVGIFDVHETEKGAVGDDEALFTAHRARILVVDDTVVNLTVAKGLLKRTGVIVDTAESGMECLELCDKYKYDIILLDHRMPQMDGVETLHILRSESRLNRDSVVIALTANITSGIEEYYIREGFTGYLSKPISGTVLEKNMFKYLPKELLDTEEDLVIAIEEEEGVKACGGMDMYMTVVTDSISNRKQTLRELKQYLEAGDYRNFTVKVHALKNLARMLGATGVSKEALYLEKCGDEGRNEIIDKQAPGLFEHFIRITDTLAQKYDINISGGGKEAPAGLIREMLETLKELAGTFDFDSADRVFKELKEYRIPDAMEDDFDQLGSALYNYDDERIKTYADKCLQIV